MKFDKIIDELDIEIIEEGKVAKTIAPLVMAILLVLGLNLNQKYSKEIVAAREFIKNTPTLQTKLDDIKDKDKPKISNAKNLAREYKSEWIEFIDEYIKQNPDAKKIRDKLITSGEVDIHSSLFK